MQFKMKKGVAAMLTNSTGRFFEREAKPSQPPTQLISWYQQKQLSSATIWKKSLINEGFASVVSPLVASASYNCSLVREAERLIVTAATWRANDWVKVDCWSENECSFDLIRFEESVVNRHRNSKLLSLSLHQLKLNSPIIFVLVPCRNNQRIFFWKLTVKIACSQLPQHDRNW